MRQHQVKESKRNTLTNQYELFQKENDESIKICLFRFTNIVNGLKSLGKHIQMVILQIKFLDHFPNLRSQRASLTSNKNFKTLHFENLLESIITHEMIFGRDQNKRSEQVVLKFLCAQAYFRSVKEEKCYIGSGV